MKRMFRVLTKPGLVILLCLSVSGVAFAQNEEGFVRAATVSKRDAVALSVLFPGLGQMTAGSKVKGVSFFISEMVSLAVFANAHEDYSTKLDIYNRDRKTLDGLASTLNETYTHASDQFTDLQRQQKSLDDLNKTRNVALAVAAGVYAYNLFDAVFLTSYDSDGKKAEKLGNVTVQSVMVEKAPGILISKRF